MDNEAPNYASWIPEAGGYVANGKVVSKSPIYDEAGKLRLDVDTSVFGNTQTPSTAKAQPQVANQATSNVGVTTANVAGSGTDANAQATGIGSLDSMAQNTQNAIDSALSSPAMRSPSAGEPILTIEQQDLKEIQDAHARNDLQGEINGYVKLARDTGVDYTQTINDLTRQRQQKIQNVDDSYLQRLDEARQRMNAAKSQGDITGDYTAYNQAAAEYGALVGEQDTWRNAVGYEQSMRDMYNQEVQDLQIDYEDTWLKSVKAFSDQLVQMIPALMNFQYDPTQDANLLRAQALVEMRMRNNAAATGMYYSSTTQFAIAQAIGELIPVYQKMAREEAIENFKLLQSTASFLMNLEQTQFDMWKSQIQLKFQEAEEKRAQQDQAIQNANARGFYTNEEAALLGIAPGTESQAARERALDKQEQIEKELRNLEQSKTLYEFQEKLQTQEYEKRKAIDAKYQKVTNSGTYLGLTYSQWKSYAKEYAQNGGDVNDIAEDLKGSDFTQTQIDSILTGANTKTPNTAQSGEGTIDYSQDLDNKDGWTAAQIKTEANRIASSGELTTDAVLSIIDIAKNAKTWKDMYQGLAEATYESGGVEVPVIDTNLLNSLQGDMNERVKAIDEYYSTLALAEQNGENALKTLKTLADEGGITTSNRNKYANAYIKSNLLKDITLNSNLDNNTNQITAALNRIGENQDYMNQDQLYTAYKTLFDKISSAGTKNNPFRYSKPEMKEGNILSKSGKQWYDVDAGVSGNASKSKERAMLGIMQDINTNKTIANEEARVYVLKKLGAYVFDKATGNLADGYGLLKDKNNYAIKID